MRALRMWQRQPQRQLRPPTYVGHQRPAMWQSSTQQMPRPPSTIHIHIPAGALTCRAASTLTYYMRRPVWPTIILSTWSLEHPSRTASAFTFSCISFCIFVMVVPTTSTLLLLLLHRVRKKKSLEYFKHNFIKYWPIFEILSLLQSAGNLQ